jgi:hypothetical protein
MNWEAIGAIGEIVGATAVVLTLIYVAIQIKQNTAASRAQAINQINSQWGGLMSQIATNEGLAKIYRKATEGGDLGPDETVQYTAYMSAFFAFLEELYLLHQSGTYEEDLGEGDALEFLTPTVRRLLSSPAAVRWWKEESRNLYVAEVCNRVNLLANLTYDLPADNS